MKYFNTVLFLFALSINLGACGPTAKEGHEGEKGGEHKEDAQEEEEGVVHLSKEAVARSGIKVEQVSAEKLIGGIEVPAEIQLNPDRTVRITALAPGKVTEVKAKLGDIVTKEQPLLTIRSEALGEARGSIAAATATINVARSSVKRQEELKTAGIGSEKDYLTAVAELKRAEADLSIASSRLAVYSGGKGGGGNNTSITSPLDGTIIERNITPGEVVSTEKTIFVVADLSKVWVVGRLYEQDISAAIVGAPVSIYLQSYPGKSFEGVISFVADTLDEQSRTLAVRVELDNPEKLLKPGLSATIALSPPDNAGQAVVVVPEDAVQKVEGKEVVFIPGEEAGEFEAVPVVTGARVRGRVEIREGLKPGDSVVVKGAFTLKSQASRAELGEGHAH